jgi:hypothetical protein
MHVQTSMQAIDSFGRIAQYGGVYAPSETAEMYVQGFTLFGVKELLLAYMTDASPASFKMERSLVGKFHALCFQHFRQHLWDAIATFSLDATAPLAECASAATGSFRQKKIKRRRRSSAVEVGKESGSSPVSPISDAWGSSCGGL